MTRVPVLLVSGFLGAGKTELLARLLEQDRSLAPAVLINDLAAPAPAERPALPPRVDATRLTGGCICCSIRDDFLQRVGQLVAQGRHDALFVEGSGVSEPLPVAEALARPDGAGRPLSAAVALKTAVTVVDARGFLDGMGAAASLADLGLAASPDDRRYLSELLFEQVEHANWLVLNKIDLVSDAQRAWLTELLGQLNPDAKIIAARHCQVDCCELADARQRDAEPVRYLPGWLRALAGAPAPAGTSFGIATHTYTARRPFHPQRLWQRLQRWPWRGVFRSRGFVWLASRPTLAGLWNQAGRVVNVDLAGEWWAAVPAEQRDEAPPWHPEFGDRRQDLAFIGQGVDPGAIKQALDACLLTDAEMAHGPAGWFTLVDPFPQWDLQASLVGVGDAAGHARPS